MQIAFLVSCFAVALMRLEVAGKMQFKDQCLYWHNYFRTLHQVPTVTWSASLQKEAEDWVKYLAENNKFEHSQKNPGNLYMTAPGQRPPEFCSDAVWWFHNEEKFYNYSKPGYVHAAGHFTQVVWRNSKQIGAAWAIRKDNRLVISIKYNPGGNYVGYFARNVFRPIAQILGPEWPHLPPGFARCPAKDIQTPPTTVPTTSNMSVQTPPVTLVPTTSNMSSNMTIPTISETLGPSLTRLPSTSSSSLASIIQTTPTTLPTTINMTKPTVKAAAGRMMTKYFSPHWLLYCGWLIIYMSCG